MKTFISTVAAVAVLSSLPVTSAHAGNHGGGIDPVWIPVAVLSTIAAAAIIQPVTVVHEHRIVHEPRTGAAYEVPRHHHRHPRHHEYDSRHEAPRFRDYEYR